MSKSKKSHVSDNQIHQAISGIPYPVSKADLIKYARGRSDNGGVVDMLKKLPEMDYRHEPQVLSTLKEYLDA